MESNKNDTSPNPGQKTGIENLSKDELISKYKGVLNLAKKAKQAKDELALENRTLKEALLRSETQKEADKKALLTMKETLEQFTEQKLQLSTELEELRQKSRNDNEVLTKLRIENESLRRQMDSLTTDNETLLNDIDTMENQLKKVNLIGLEQKKHLELLELEVNRLKERDCHSASLEQRLNVSLEENKALKAQQQLATKSLEELTQKYKSIKEINAEQRQKFNTLKDRFVDVYRKLKKLKECKCVLLETQHEYADAVSKWQNDIIQASKQLCGQMHALQAENEELQKQLKSMENSVTQGADVDGGIQMKLLTQKLRELSDLTSEALREHKQQQLLAEEEQKALIEKDRVTMSELEAQQLENRRLTQELSDLKVKLEDDRRILSTLQAADSANEARNMEVEQLEHEKAELQHQLSVQIAQYEKLKSELESKMEKSENSTQELESLNAELKTCRQSYEALLDRFELKEREHTDLLGEMRELNEALKARGDVISRQEEKQQELIAELKRGDVRLQQLEASLRENEQLTASKEHELQELSAENEASKAKVQELEAIVTRNEEHIADITEELQSLRQSGSTYDTQSDAVSVTSNMSRAEELNRLREFDEGNEERYNKLRTLAAKLKKKLQEQIAQTTELTQQLQSKETLQKEFEECQAKLKALEQLNSTLENENKKFKTSRKQANVLNLEIEAAERSLSEVSAKLNAKNAELSELNAILQTKESTIVQLRKEIMLLEAAKTSECEHAKELKAQIDRLQTQIKDAVHGKQTALDNSKDLEFAQERLQLEIEDLRLQLAECASKQEAKISELHAENTQLNSKLQEMEAALATTQATLKSTTRSLEDARVEYMEYKVKAQAVLRKNQSKDITHERELEEELLAARSKSQQLETHAQMLGKKLEETEKQLEEFKENMECTTRRNDELHKLIEELRLQNDSLMQEQRVLMQAQQDALRQQRQQLENVEVCHKEQIESVEHSYQRQIEQLKGELSKSMRQPTIIGAAAKILPINNANELLLMEREDAEGSEEVNATLSALAAKRKISNASSSRRSVHEFMPLDELLNAPLNTLNSETLLSNSYQVEDNINGNLKTDCTEHLELIRHLRLLLAENEQDLAKLTQMNDVLKEELRRQERSVEREQHMHNSEYLKNVFLKFLTLHSVDERTRLVPVLNTILKLSRSEVEMLNCVAKGQKITEPNNRSWSNFLPSWGGGGNSGN